MTPPLITLAIFTTFFLSYGLVAHMHAHSAEKANLHPDISQFTYIYADERKKKTIDTSFSVCCPATDAAITTNNNRKIAESLYKLIKVKCNKLETE